MTEPFWKTKTLEEMNAEEWESLCDGCGRCCLHKLVHATTQKIAHTNIACKLLDCHSGRCSNYQHRHEFVPDCVRLTPAEIRQNQWLPPTCGYIKIRDGKDLEPWHPLVSGDPNSVHAAGISVRGRAMSEQAVPKLLWQLHVVDWPEKE